MRAECIWTLPEVGASGLTGGDGGAGGYMPLAVVVGSGASAALRWVHGDHMGVPLVTTDANGAAVTPTGYALSGLPGQFANAVLLPGAAHDYNRYRDYDPTTGRYIQADPIGLAGDANPYRCALGNPLRYVHPSGEVAWIVPVAAAFAFGVGVDLAIQALSNWTAGKSVADPANYDLVSAALSGGLNVVTGGAGGLFGGARAAGAVCGSLDDTAGVASAADDAASHGFCYADRVTQRGLEDPKAHKTPLQLRRPCYANTSNSAG